MVMNFDDTMDKWDRLTGFDADKSRLNLHEWHIRDINESIADIRRIENGDLTAWGMLDYFVRTYLNSKTFTVKDLIVDPDAVDEYLRITREVFATLHSDDIQGQLVEFRQMVHRSLSAMDAADVRETDVANSVDSLIFLRRDALVAIDKLHTYQFLMGEFSDKPPVMLKTIHQFWDVNNLIMAMRDQTWHGVSVNLICHPSNPERSYFAFGIRNGDNIIVLTDKVKWAFPGQADLRRRPERDFAKRVASNHFPYELIRYDVDEEGEVFFNAETGLVPIQATSVPMTTISQLPPHQAIWLTMMSSLISNRFWRHRRTAKELAYTGEMIQHKNRLIEGVDPAALPAVTDYRPLQLDRLAANDVIGEKVVEHLGKSVGINQWMVDRYGHCVSDDIVNLIGDSTSLVAVDDDGKVIAHKHDQFKRLAPWNRPSYKLQRIDPTDFGTEDELRADQAFIGRHNAAKSIQKAVNDDYDRLRKFVIDSYWAAIRDNEDNIFEMVRKSPDGTPIECYKDGIGHIGNNMVRNTGDGMIVKAASLKSMLWDYDDFYGEGNCLIGSINGGKYHCHVTDAVASYRIKILPRTVDDLIALVGSKENLPDLLHHWYSRHNKPYVGNHILYRIDPFDVMNNPWSKCSLGVIIYLSKRGWKQLQLPSINP